MRHNPQDSPPGLLLTLEPTERALVEAAARLQGTPVIAWAELALIEYARKALYTELREEPDATAR